MKNNTDIFSDNYIYKALTESKDLDSTFMKLLLIELLSRIRKLEQVNFALQAVLLNEKVVDHESMSKTIKNAADYINSRDEAKARFCEFMKDSGMSFEQWVNFYVEGTFDK